MPTCNLDAEEGLDAPDPNGQAELAPTAVQRPFVEMLSSIYLLQFRCSTTFPHASPH
jgi:hypothetical protein